MRPGWGVRHPALADILRSSTPLAAGPVGGHGRRRGERRLRPGPGRLGIAIGAGTDVAIESAGVVLASSDPRGVTGVIRLSRASYRKMLQNLGWAAGYNVIAIPLAAGVLAWAGLTLSPAIGAILMSLSTIVLALNAQTLRRVDLTPEPVAA
jgi:hypothetical protein